MPDSGTEPQIAGLEVEDKSGHLAPGHDTRFRGAMDSPGTGNPRAPARPLIHAALASVLVVGALVLSGCVSEAPRHVTRRFFRMDTVTDVTIVRRGRLDESALWADVDSLLMDWEQRFSVSGRRSEVARVNSVQEDTVPISRTLALMIHDALRYGDTLDGAFDLTVLPLKRLWGFDETTPATTTHSVPHPDSISEALARVDYRTVDVTFEPYTIVRRRPGVLIDVGGIAKGYVLREVSRILQSYGLNDYIISAGGDVLVRGQRHDGARWRIGIQHPRDRADLLATIEADSGTIVTSGDYERYWMAGDRRVHHIFDPRTGYSCDENQSVTVLSPDPVEADILSTGLFCLPADSILAFVDRRPRLQALVVDSAGVASASRGWGKRLHWNQPRPAPS